MELVTIFVADRWQVFAGGRDKVYALGDRVLSWMRSSLCFVCPVKMCNRDNLLEHR